MSRPSFHDSIQPYKFEIVFVLFLSAFALLLPLLGSLTASGDRTYTARVKSAPTVEAKAHAIQAKDQDNIAAINEYGSTSAVWPMRGKVTADFGVPHMPWQHKHTGIDISSGKRGGASITTFKKGTVSSTVYSGSGLGNHVIVDHGDNITSYYSHLSKINVKEGQTVAPGDVLGVEGNTGVSTGPHLHLEIRVNNKPVNPRQFIRGNP